MDAPIWRETINELISLGLIRALDPGKTPDARCYMKTEKLDVYVEHILKTPLPEQVWVVK
jgi:hypothetical protein